MTAQPASGKSYAGVLRLPLWPAVGLIASTPLIAWHALGPQKHTGPDYMFGPYNIAPPTVTAASAFSLAVGAACLLAAIVPWIRGRSGQSLSFVTTVTLVVAVLFGSYSWWVMTSGGGGANIGGSFLLLVTPPVISLLALFGFLFEVQSRRLRPRARWLSVILALAITPLLWTLTTSLQTYDASIGVVSAGEVESIELGDPRQSTLGVLDAPLRDPVDWFFPTPPPDLQCDYYQEEFGSGPEEASPVFRVCYRNDTVISIDTSTHPYFPGG